MRFTSILPLAGWSQAVNNSSRINSGVLGTPISVPETATASWGIFQDFGTPRIEPTSSPRTPPKSSWSDPLAGRPTHTGISTKASTRTRITSRSTIRPPTEVGFETISIVNVVTSSFPQKRQAVLEVTQPVSVYRCPIYSIQVPDAPCYPCVLATPTAPLAFGVRRTSVLDRAPDATPTFWYSLCPGCQPTQVVTPVPGYAAGTRNFDACVPQTFERREPTPRTVSGSGQATRLSPTTPPALRPTTLPKTPGSLTTTAFVTAEIIMEIQVISICSAIGTSVTTFGLLTTCTTYETCVTIPATLCDTYASTLGNGDVKTYTTPVKSWEDLLLATEIKSTARAVNVNDDSSNTLAVAVTSGYTGVGNVSPVSLISPGFPKAPAAPGTLGAPSSAGSPVASGPFGSNLQSSPPQQTTFVQSGSGHLIVSLSAIFLSFLGLAI